MRKFLLLSCAILIAGCESLMAQTEHDALLNVGDTASVAHTQQELSATIAKMIKVSKLRLGSDELSKTSMLTVERSQLRDASGLLMQGLETEEPNVFKLVKRGDACFLIHLKTGKREELNLSCHVKP